MSDRRELLRSWAFRLIEEGYLVLPVWGVDPEGNCFCRLREKCRQPGQHPHAACGKHGFKGASRDLARLAWWLTTEWSYEQGNLGIVIRSGEAGIAVRGACGIAEWIWTTRHFNVPKTVGWSVGRGIGMNALYRVPKGGVRLLSNRQTGLGLKRVFPIAPGRGWLLTRPSITKHGVCELVSNPGVGVAELPAGVVDSLNGPGRRFTGLIGRTASDLIRAELGLTPIFDEEDGRLRVPHVVEAARVEASKWLGEGPLDVSQEWLLQQLGERDNDEHE